MAQGVWLWLLYPPDPKDNSNSFWKPQVPSPHILTLKTRQEFGWRKRPRKEQERGKKEKGERKEREGCLEIFRTISILYGASVLKKNERNDGEGERVRQV